MVTSNHYQPLSVEALEVHGIQTVLVKPVDLQLATAALRTAAFHIDWLDPFVAADRPMRYRIRAQLLLATAIVGCVVLRKPIIWSLHNEQPHSGASMSWRVWSRVLAKTSSAMITFSDAGSRAAKAMRPRAKVVALTFGTYLGVVPRSDRSTARERFGFADELVMVHFGQIRPQKNVLGLLEAFRCLGSTRVRLVVAGRAQPATHADAIREAVLADGRVSWVDRRLPEEELGALLSAADVAVLPFSAVTSTSSGHLAAEFGLPIIGPDCDALAPYGGEYLYAPGDPSGLLDALARCVSNWESSRLPRAALEAPSWEDATAPLADVYRGRRPSSLPRS